MALQEIERYRPNILHSFFYVDDKTPKLINVSKNFLMDSGAFSFMMSKPQTIHWEGYINRYADYINKYGIEHFFELDIDSIVGYDKVLEYRSMLKQKTGIEPIPVWHKSRGIQNYYEMCQEYDYVSIGGIVSKEITKDEYKAFPKMIDYAHKNNAKIHGLGFTNLKLLPKYHFDSVDSTSWVSSARFGCTHRFTGTTMETIKKPEWASRVDSNLCALNSFKEWMKFQRYAEVYL